MHEGPYGLSWTVEDPMERSSHALVDRGRVWLVDPTDDPAVLERAAGLGEPVAVLQLLDRHGRDCAALAARLGVPHERVPGELPGTPFHVLSVLDNRIWHEVALWWPERSVLVVAEAIGTNATFAPGGAGAGVHIGVRLRPPRQLAAYAPEHLLVGHGPALHGPGATLALREALERSQRDLPRAVGVMSKALLGAVRG